MRSITLCALLHLPAAVYTAKAPIRIIGTLTDPSPVAPFSKSYNPLVPCATISDTEGSECNLAGYPSVAAWMANLSSDARGTVKFMVPDYRSRGVLAHPDGLKLNHEVWRNLDLDFVTMRNEYVYVSGQGDVVLEDFTRLSPYPWVMSDFVVNYQYAITASLLHRWHIKVVDGVKIGILVLWTNSDKDRTFSSLPHERVLPILTRRLRLDGVDKIVVIRTGRGAPPDDLLVLTANDVDVVVTDILREPPPPYARNGTTVLSAPYKTDGGNRNDLLVLDMVEDAGLWQYTLRDISLLTSKPAAYRSDPVYIAARQWSQVQADLSAANDVVVVETTAPMEPAVYNSYGGFVCMERECQVGTLTADALREYAGTDMAFLNSASARSGPEGWPVGPVRRSTLWATYPFGNTVCRTVVSATLLIAILNNGISQLFPNGTHDPTQRGGRFAQISGFRYTLNPKLPPGSRVVSVDVMQPDGTFAPLERRRLYSLATPSFILGGGAGYDMIGSKQHGPSECLVATMMEATKKYLMKRKTYTPYTDGRIANDYNGVTLPMRNQTLAECTDLEKHDPFWQYCVPCEVGFWRPDATSNVCIEKVSEGMNTTLIVGIIVGVAVAATMIVGLALAAMHRAGLRRASQQAHRVRHAPRDADADIAIVFTDIKCSTDLWAAHHADMAVALQQHHRICRELIEEHQGYEVKTIGDAFMVAFVSPVDAVAFMLDLQMQLLHAEWPEGLLSHPACCKMPGLFNGLRVRAGAHYGFANIVETPTGGYDYDGTTCNLAARVSDSGDGGQVVVTEDMYRAVEPNLDLLQLQLKCVPDVSFLGSYIFKGVPGEIACYQILPDDLAGRLFNDLRNVQAPRHPPDGKLDVTDDNRASASAKAQLTRAMQALRLWVTRDHQGVSLAQLNALFAAGVKGDAHLLETVLLAVLRVLAGRTDHVDPPPPRSLRFEPRGSGSSDSPSLRSASRAAGGGHSASTTLRWTVVVEILNSLPPRFVIELESHIADDAIYPCSTEVIAALSAAQQVGGTPPPQPCAGPWWWRS